MSDDRLPPTDDLTPDNLGANGVAEPDTPTPRIMSEDDRITISRDSELGDADPDDVIRLRNYDVATLISAASFGSVIPGAVDAALANILWTVERHGEFSLTNGGGTMAGYFKELEGGPKDNDASGGDKEEDDDLYIELVMEHRRERQEMEQREREWREAQHSIGNVTKTGDEWLELADKLKKGSPLYDWLVADMRKNGEKDPEKLADLVRLRMQMQGIPPEQWTDAMKDADAYLKAHPEVAGKVDGYIARVHERDLEMKAKPDSTLNGVNPDAQVANNISSQDSVAAGADLFASAPDLVEHHQAAMAATEPLDSDPTPDPQTPPPSPVRVAVVAPGGGFDV